MCGSLITRLSTIMCAAVIMLCIVAITGCAKMAIVDHRHNYRAQSICQISRAGKNMYGKTIVIKGALERGVHFNDRLVDDNCPNTTYRLLSDSAAKLQIDSLDDVIWCNYGKAPSSSPRIFITLRGYASKITIFDAITAESIMTAQVDMASVAGSCKKVAKRTMATWKK